MKRFGVIALIVMLGGVQGYDLWPRSFIHESLTAAAKRCYDRSRDRKPERCDPRLPENSAGIDMAWIHRPAGFFSRLIGGERYPTLDLAVRWPDDPTRQIVTLAIPSYGLSIQRKCGKLAARRGAGVNGLEDGLLCNSHVGTMQFFHAQADTSGVAATITYDQIMGWAAFLYSVAAQRSDAELDVSFCSALGGDGAFSAAMLRSGNGERCALGWMQKLRLADFFTIECEIPFLMDKCAVTRGTNRFDKARIVATGALLHVIQDSYSQSHCERGQCGGGGGMARVDCVPISMFTTYTGQDEKRHAKADRVPAFRESCRSSTRYDDPITASAKVLWHIAKHNPPNVFMADMERVFGTREAVEQGARVSGLGACFAKR